MAMKEEKTKIFHKKRTRGVVFFKEINWFGQFVSSPERGKIPAREEIPLGFYFVGYLSSA